MLVALYSPVSPISCLVGSDNLALEDDTCDRCPWHGEQGCPVILSGNITKQDLTDCPSHIGKGEGWVRVTRWVIKVDSHDECFCTVGTLDRP